MAWVKQSPRMESLPKTTVNLEAEWGEWEWRNEPSPFGLSMSQFMDHLTLKWFEREFAQELRIFRERSKN